MNQRIISAECLPPHLKLHIIHQKLQRSPLQNGADSRVAISLGLMLFFENPLGSADHAEPLNYDPVTYTTN